MYVHVHYCIATVVATHLYLFFLLSVLLFLYSLLSVLLFLYSLLSVPPVVVELFIESSLCLVPKRCGWAADSSGVITCTTLVWMRFNPLH